MRSYLFLFVLFTSLTSFVACPSDDTGSDGGIESDNIIDESTCDDNQQNGDETGVDCGGSCDACDTDESLAKVYAFSSRFQDESSVAYDGQLSRWMLLEELNNELNNLDPAAMNGPTDGQAVQDLLSYYFDYADVGGDGSDPLNICPADVTCVQGTYGEVGSIVSLDAKLPENDIDWTAPVQGALTEMSSREFVNMLITRIADNYQLEKVDGVIRINAANEAITKVYIDEDGTDLKQVLQKFIMGAVMYSQGVSDYLRLSVDGKGLESDNIIPAVSGGETKSYTDLEHIWDEAFGYFGASRFMPAFTSEEIAGLGGRQGYENGYWDQNEDAELDLKTERNQGYVQTAAKRDQAVSSTDAQTELAYSIYDGFYNGRALITEVADTLNDTQKAQLLEIRDQVVNDWERAIGATVVHYINETIKDHLADAYSFIDHAKHWSEAYGYALQIQYNSTRLISDETQGSIFAALGSNPLHPSVVTEENLNARLDALRAVRISILADLSIDPSFAGDDTGTGGF